MGTITPLITLELPSGADVTVHRRRFGTGKAGGLTGLLSHWVL